jgi:hypothetical protein
LRLNSTSRSEVPTSIICHAPCPVRCRCRVASWRHTVENASCRKYADRPRGLLKAVHALLEQVGGSHTGSALTADRERDSMGLIQSEICTAFLPRLDREWSGGSGIVSSGIKHRSVRRRACLRQVRPRCKSQTAYPWTISPGINDDVISPYHGMAGIVRIFGKSQIGTKTQFRSALRTRLWPGAVPGRPARRLSRWRRTFHIARGCRPDRP